ncbi:hypothetical protein Ancab_015991 [Ancistrocladus abbreviatus]
MATTNPFDLLGDDDNDDPSLLLAAQQEKIAAAVAKKGSVPATAAVQPAKQAKLPTKPPPPAQAVRDAKSEGPRGGARGGGRGYGRGRGGGGFNRDYVGGENAAGSDNGFQANYKLVEERESGRPSERRGYGGPRGGFRGGRRGGFSNGEAGEGERPRRGYDRRSGTGRGSEIKRDGAGRGNWGTPTDEITPETEEPAAEAETNVVTEKQVMEEETVEAKEENQVNEPEEKEPEEKQMTLEEYQKVLEEKRKALAALKTEERKVDVDKEFESMQLVSKKKGDDDVFIKLGSEKEKRREAAEKEERAKKSVSINEFLKPAEGEAYYRSGGRGRGRGGRGPRGGFSEGNSMSHVSAPSIEDPGQFPSLGAK